MAQTEWHVLAPDAVAGTLKTNPNRGLASGEARGRLSRVGPNEVAQKKAVSPLVLFVGQFQDFMVLVLLGATLVSGLLGEIEDAVTILAIVILNAVLGFVQEFRAEKSLAALKQLAAPTGKVIRDGSLVQVPSIEIVPGDVILLEAGDKVPADARLCEAASMEVEESALTGESVPAKKDASTVRNERTGIGDRMNMVYSSTIVTQGRGRAIVVATGMATELGKIAKMIHEAEDEETPLTKRLEHLGKWLVGLCLGLCALVVAAGVLRGEPWDRMFLTGVSLAVAAIPEGLPAIVTIALAIGVQRMIRRSAIVRKLPAVETLGCTTVICSDKTGTLTQNAMTVTSLWVSGQSIEVTGTGYEPVGRFVLNGSQVAPDKHPDLEMALRVCALCNNSQVVADLAGGALGRLRARIDRDEKRWRAQGDPTEAALAAAAMKGGLSASTSLARVRRIGEVPFSSDRKRMSVACQDPRGGRFAFVKGAPDVILDRCTYYLKTGKPEPLTPVMRDQILRKNDSYATSALRVLGLAYREIASRSCTEENMEKGLVFVGLAGMMDPPREEAKAAIKTARKAGIRTVMITGDHKATAIAVAVQLGLLESGGRAVTGDDIDRWSDTELVRAVEGISVYARVSPSHKLRIVRAWKKKGHIVAMTGDGVNDAPAVKEADIGVSMGISGTDVTKEASSMVLADDNYATIVAAVEEGRGIYSNIRKFIRYLLACNMGEVLTMFLATVGGLPLPLLPMQILWTNLVTDGLPALALGVDPTEKGIMERRPRDPRESVFSGGLQQKIMVTGLSIAVCTLAAFVYGLWMPGGYLARAQTMAFATLVLSQLVYVFSCRSEHKTIFELGFLTNMYLVIAVAVSLAMQLAVMYVPFLQVIFKTTNISIVDWVVVSVLSGWSLALTGFARFAKRTVARRIALVKA